MPSLKELSFKIENLSHLKKMALTAFLVVVFVALGFGLGAILRKEKVEPLPSPTPFPQASPSAKPKEEKETLSGKILSLGPSIYMEGTHQLVDEEGNLIALLKADDDKLTLAEGFRVEVEGETKKTVEGNIKIMKVEVVRFK